MCVCVCVLGLGRPLSLQIKQGMACHAPSLLPRKGMGSVCLYTPTHMHGLELHMPVWVCVRVHVCIHLMPLFLSPGSHRVPLRLYGLRNESTEDIIMYNSMYNQVVCPYIHLGIEFHRHLSSAYHVPGLMRSGEAPVTKAELFLPSPSRVGE